MNVQYSSVLKKTDVNKMMQMYKTSDKSGAKQYLQSVLENDEYSLKDNEYLYPENYDEVVSNASYYQDLPAEIKTYYGDLWTQIKGGG